MSVGNSTESRLEEIYRRLLDHFGPQGWWPGNRPIEVVVGAILTQNTAWTNVEKALANLRKARVLSWRRLHALSVEELAELIRPAGTFRVKAKRLRAFLDVLWTHHQGSLKVMLAGELDEVRGRLLGIHGVGPETADAILLYAGNHPSFVIDAYTLRVLRRHFLTDGRADYELARRLFQEHLPRDVSMYNEYHALFVALGKRYCRARAHCDGCPLEWSSHDASL